jgi:membrane-associated phospholipid phosphatase
MRQKLLILILSIILYESPLSAQNQYTFSQFGHETVDFIKQPLKWKWDDYLKIGLIGAGGGLMMFADQPIRDAVQKDQRYYNSVPIELGRMYGSVYSPMAFFGGFAIYSLIADDIKAKKIAYEIGQASIYAGAINYFLKVAIGRARPNQKLGAGIYHPFSTYFTEDFHSFPGGHSTAAFTLSTVLSRNVKPVWLKILFYVPAVITMASRVYQDWHWTSDCLVGAAFGYFIATWVVDQHEKTDKSVTIDSDQGMLERIQLQPTDSDQGMMERIQLQPIIMGGFYGLNLSVRIH